MLKGAFTTVPYPRSASLPQRTYRGTHNSLPIQLAHRNLVPQTRLRIKADHPSVRHKRRFALIEQQLDRRRRERAVRAVLHNHKRPTALKRVKTVSWRHAHFDCQGETDTMPKDANIDLPYSVYSAALPKHIDWRPE